MNAYETPEYYFADYGEAVTGDDGKVRVDIDPMFAETVNLSRYMTHVTPTELVLCAVTYDQWKEVYDELKLIQNETKLVRTEKKNENSFFFDGYAILMLETVAKQNIKAPKKELSDNIDNALAELRYYVMQIKDVRITR
ncbi:hypothetical protein EfmAA242_26240 [Enterococcus faecium]|nr:hypothetical protein EfmAA242_26240 [Enterococcus faecium]